MQGRNQAKRKLSVLGTSRRRPPDVAQSASQLIRFQRSRDLLSVRSSAAATRMPPVAAPTAD
jgi:hypothetical protein